MEFKNNHSINYIKKNTLEYIQFPNLTKYSNILTHCFTTRRGGVSSGECNSLNLGFNKNDLRENVLNNYKIMSKAIEVDYKNMVFSNQVHDNKIKTINEKDRGKGIIIKNDIIGYDGLMTNVEKVAIVTFYADCVPVFFFDPIKRVIAISHSGWRGTMKEISGETIIKMVNEFGCKAGDIETAIGPSIGKCCFEVGDEVYIEFTDKLKWSKDYCEKSDIGKWHFDLQGIIKQTLINSGVSEEKICTAGICTKCNKDVFFSYRGDNGKTGSLAAIIYLNDSNLTLSKNI
jgi:polyphenol oxidase